MPQSIVQKNNMFNLKLIGIGVLALVPGILIYITDRPASRTYFVEHAPFPISLYGKVPELFGSWGFILPEFVHVFGFILITAGILNGSRKTFLPISLFWLVVDLLFEWGQKFGGKLAAWVPDFFANIPFFENTASYFERGTFDPHDILAIIAGTVSAYLLLLAVDVSSKQKNEAAS